MVVVAAAAAQCCSSGYADVFGFGGAGGELLLCQTVLMFTKSVLTNKFSPQGKYSTTTSTATAAAAGSGGGHCGAVLFYFSSFTWSLLL
jgi:hypothetical protein